jgi:acyl-CoA reductase-like NAD-dependent aldehyde dehydrogenase
LAVGRVLVPRKLAKPLGERLRSLLGRLRQGDPQISDFDLGALSTKTQLERCRAHVDGALSMGATAFTAPSANLPTGHYFPATVLTHCSADCLAYCEEAFGPVLPVVEYDDLSETVASLNRDPLGLCAYVFGSELAQTERVAESLDYGHVLIDQVLLTYACPELPLAGLRDSGLGVVHGTEGLLARTTPRVIGAPRVRLPSTVEFNWCDPKRATLLAEGYLASKTTWNRWFDWASR